MKIYKIDIFCLNIMMKLVNIRVLKQLFSVLFNDTFQSYLMSRSSCNLIISQKTFNQEMTKTSLQPIWFL